MRLCQNSKVDEASVRVEYIQCVLFLHQRNDVVRGSLRLLKLAMKAQRDRSSAQTEGWTRIVDKAVNVKSEVGTSGIIAATSGHVAFAGVLARG